MSYLSVITLKAIGRLSREFVDDDDAYEQITGELEDAISGVLKKYDLELLSLEMMSHDLKEQHFTRCENCSSWMINRSKEKDRDDVDDGIKDGGEYQSRLLCEDCLPEGHPWSWKRI